MEYVKIEIPKSLAEKLKTKAEKQGYTLKTYVIQILREASIGEREVTNLTNEEDELIKKRLRELGYM